MQSISSRYHSSAASGAFGPAGGGKRPATVGRAVLLRAAAQRGEASSAAAGLPGPSLAPAALAAAPPARRRGPTRAHRGSAPCASPAPAPAPGTCDFLDSIRWDSAGLVPAIVQDADTGEVLMQAFSDRAAVRETLSTGLATFYSRSRRGRWCKGETSGHTIRVIAVHVDCDADSLLYLGVPAGPACHTNATSCYFRRIEVGGAGEHGSGPASPAGAEGARDPEAPVEVLGGDGEAGPLDREDAALPTLLALERLILQRQRAEEERKLEEAEEKERATSAAASGPGAAPPPPTLPPRKPSWTARLLSDPALTCAKIREEAGELCQSFEEDEGASRTISEAADLVYHAMVLLRIQGVDVSQVAAELRRRFGTSGIDEKAGRKPKSA